MISQTIGEIEKKYSDKIILKKIPNKKLFETLSEFNIEKHLKDSINIEKSIAKLPDSIKTKYSPEEIRAKYIPFKYINNRSRTYYNEYYKGIKKKKKEYLQKGMDLPCQCFIKNDTLTIRTGTGFFGGFGFYSKVYNNRFKNYFYEYSEEKEIQIDSKYQKLILENQPENKKTLTGYFKLFTNDYYEDKNTYGEVYFKCLVYLKE